MIHWIALKYNNWSGVEAGDLENELWIKCNKIILDKQEINIKFLATSCYHYAIDVCRKAKRRLDKYTTMDYSDVEKVLDKDIDYTSMGNNDFHAVDGHSMNSLNHEASRLAKNNDSNASLIIRDMLDLFDGDARAIEYVKLVALYFRIDIPENEGRDADSTFGNKKYEYEIAKAMGFANDMSSSYRNVRERVRHKLYVHGFYEYLSIPEEDQREF